MRALTIRQPWADAIAHGTKRTENRTWTTAYRGELLIHAAAQHDRNVICHNDRPDTRSAIIAVARLAAIHYGYDYDQDCCDPKWAEVDAYHWVLADVRALPEPVPCKGRLGLWTPSAEVLDAVRQQLGEVAR